ncbi:MAG: hypothetical protein L0I80_00435 [Brevibacterium sp.]|uniref:hypothetical protein n=1 Tax=Brevibacterium sp. TaxID=1701 RepID=UPI002648B0CC|nr:hypothetical protein [Brevibacterium sp.]MDN6122325.1 hypothetical protein [Brevibacterium sp.]
MRLSFFVLTFAVHVVFWEAYCAISTVTSSFTVNGAGLPVLAFVLAFLSAAAAIVLGSGLRQPLRLIFAIVSIIAVAVPGVIEVAFLLLPDDFGYVDGFVTTVLTPLAFTPYLGMLLYPLIISAVVVDELTRRRLRTTSPTQSEQPAAEIRRGTTTDIVGFIIATLIIMFSIVLITWTAAAVFASSSAEGSSLYSQPDGVIAVCSAVIVVAVPLAFGYLANLGLLAKAAPALGLLTYLTLASGILLCTLSTIQTIYSDATGIGGTLLWLGLLFAFPVVAAATSLLSIGIVVFEHIRR